MKTLFLSFFITAFIALDWTPEEQKLAKANVSNSKMSQKEKDVLYYMNLARINPSKFEKEVLNPYLKESRKFKPKYVKTLKNELRKTKPTQPLMYRSDLFEFAQHHAKTTGKAGKVGHSSVKFKSYKNRTKKLIKTYLTVGENIQYGLNDAKAIVIDLLIDEGVKDLGHRKNILDSEYEYASVSIQPHKKFGYNCVIEFGGALKNKKATN